MLAKAVLVVCAQALLVQTAFSACGGCGGYGVGYNCLASGYGAGLAGIYGAGCGADGVAGVASTGGGLIVTSVSPITPTGISVHSENVLEGHLVAGGNLPFLGSVAFEGVVPTAGEGAVSYGCGDAVAIISEGPITTGIAVPEALYSPTSPNSAATADAIAVVPGYAAGYGISGASGYGYGAGCGNRGVVTHDIGYNRGCGCQHV